MRTLILHLCNPRIPRRPDSFHSLFEVRFPALAVHAVPSLRAVGVSIPEAFRQASQKLLVAFPVSRRTIERMAALALQRGSRSNGYPLAFQQSADRANTAEHPRRTLHGCVSRSISRRAVRKMVEIDPGFSPPAQCLQAAAAPTSSPVATRWPVPLNPFE